MPVFSIVTPVFNSFSLMSKYFDSLMNQTYKDFEVVIVDDCSTDGSYEQLMKYCKSSPLNISLLRTKKNAGPGNARNMGMDAAKGKWLTFIDNDDWVEKNLLERVEHIFIENDVDCVIFDYFIQREDKKFISRSMYYGDNGLISLSKSITYARNHSVCKVYNLAKCRERNVRFPDIRRCEDVAFVCRAIDACEKIYYLKEPMYFYFQRTTSLSNNRQLDESDMVKAFGVIEEFLGEKYPEEIKEKSVTDLLYGAVLMMCKSGKTSSEIKQYIEEYSKKYPGWELCDILNHVGKAKKLFLKLIALKWIRLLKILAWLHTKLTAG